jgi:hypothetical protein
MPFGSMSLYAKVLIAKLSFAILAYQGSNANSRRLFEASREWCS